MSEYRSYIPPEAAAGRESLYKRIINNLDQGPVIITNLVSQKMIDRMDHPLFGSSRRNINNL